jgi:hypothetical protein
MRQFLAISFLMIYLLGNTEFGQVLKLPKLWGHYHQHKKTDSHISFIQFLQMHYIGDDGTSSDNNDDMQLPCHNILNSCISSLFAPISYFNIGVIMNSPVDEITIYGGMIYIHDNAGYLNSFRQPPEAI